MELLDAPTELKHTTELWHSCGEADPLEIIASPFGFDTTYADHGTYGERALCFAAHAIYCDRLLPCHRSALRRASAERPAAALPSVGDDVLLGDERLKYEVLGVGTGADPTSCRLRQLHWEKNEAGAGQVRGYQLGADGVGDETSEWHPADVRYLILADVALGRCKDYGREEPNIKGGELLREPIEHDPTSGERVEFHSVSGTEQVRDLP